ncbi:ADP-ribosylglycohydrolase family protein [Phormidesmis priestleyi]|uniref:ADP-ribosylglycohydrolase family protein n=1 Tax=Phormidesmis priestleyi TaxID=268141 RepID=UPI00083A141F|nr:ADP-ribosylglycohydrolase family protein [Phormidesmis priestleyi]
MLGAVVGDVVGSIYERHNLKTKDFPLLSPGSRFTDDTVLTIACADVLLNHDSGGNLPSNHDYASSFRDYYRRYPNAGYGRSFANWAASDLAPAYNSWGNGSAMRVSPIGFAFNDLEQVLTEAKRSAAVTHNHPLGIKGAQATASAIFLARTGHDKAAIKSYVETTFDYDLTRTLADIRPSYRFEVSCQGSVPQAIVAFLESTDFEDAIRNAISIGGDSDTIACMAGGIAQAFYGGVPDVLSQPVIALLPASFQEVLQAFTARYPA